MWKTNKWVPEWVIRHAIAHLHQAPSALQVCLLQEQKIRRVESRRVRQSQRVTDRRETTTLRYWTCSALSNTIIPAPHSLPLYLQTENLKSFTSSFCEIAVDSLNHKGIFFSWASSMGASQIFVVATIFMSMGDFFSYTLLLGHSIRSTLVSSLFWNVPSTLLSQGLCNSFLSA